MSKRKFLSVFLCLFISATNVSTAFAKDVQAPADNLTNESLRTSINEGISNPKENTTPNETKDATPKEIDVNVPKPTLGWHKEKNIVYYIKSDNTKATGWNLIDSIWYYFNKDGSMATGLKAINGITYYLNDNGSMATGWKNASKNWYYFDNSGAMSTTWKFVDNYWYHFKTNGNMSTCGWNYINGSWYYLKQKGDMASGWLNTDGHWYYLNNSGDMAIGWKFVNGSWYYLYGAGNMINSGFQTIDGNLYYFYESGAMASATWLGQKYIYPNGRIIDASPSMCSSKTQYNLFVYMTDWNHQQDIDATAIRLHGGSTNNNCVYFLSECLRRVGFNIPRSTCNTTEISYILSQKGFEKSYNLSGLKPGDVVLSGWTHAFIFMGWADNNHDYAYIVDNQQSKFGQVMHLRKIYGSDKANDTDPSTHYFYYRY